MSKALIVNAPDLWNTDGSHPTILMLGSTAKSAGDWRAYIAKELSDYPVTLLNPARPDWDDTWKSSISDPRFAEQVKWELYAIEHSSMIVMYLEPTTQAPISLLELGLAAKDNKVLVCCPDGFWKKGNVEVVCQRYSIPLYNEINEMAKRIKTMFGSHFGRSDEEG